MMNGIPLSQRDPGISGWMTLRRTVQPRTLMAQYVNRGPSEATIFFFRGLRNIVPNCGLRTGDCGIKSEIPAYRPRSRPSLRALPAGRQAVGRGGAGRRIPKPETKLIDFLHLGLFQDSQSVIFKLKIVEPSIFSVAGDQFFMGSLLHNLTL